MSNGVLNIDKPLGMTSHDVVDATRRCLRMKAVGHTGTLDPEASGVLLLCIGRGTKFARFFESLEKTYWAVMRLGISTDTQDATGTILRECQVPPIDKPLIERVLSQFRGTLEQVPPMYSAVKHKGKRLYQLARQGKTVSRKPRLIAIRRLELLDVRGPLITLSITCSKGTYVRTLCEDIGEALGYGAHMVHLQRCSIGPFGLQHSTSLSDLKSQARPSDVLRQICLPLSEALNFFPALPVTDQQYHQLRTGQGRDIPTRPRQCTTTAQRNVKLSTLYRVECNGCGHAPATVCTRPVEDHTTRNVIDNRPTDTDKDSSERIKLNGCNVRNEIADH